MDPLFSVDRRMAYIVGHELLLQSVHENINALKPAGNHVSGYMEFLYFSFHLRSIQANLCLPGTRHI